MSSMSEMDMVVNCIPVKGETLIMLTEDKTTVFAGSCMDSSHVIPASELLELDNVDVDSKVILKKSQNDNVDQETIKSTTENSDHFSCAIGDSGMNSRWRRNDTLKLIELYKEYKEYFENRQYKKKTVWAMLAAKLAKGSQSKIRYTGAQVYNRWKNLTKLYRDSVKDLEKGPWMSKCQYFSELESVYTYHGKNDLDTDKYSQTLSCKKQKSASRNLMNRRASKGKHASVANSFVTIAPKISVSVLPLVSSDLNSVIYHTENTTSFGGSAVDVHGKCFEDIVKIVHELNEDQKRRDHWKMDLLEKMHKEKMQKFAEFLDILKS